MEFRNLTPFDVMCLSALDLQHTEHPVIAMKVGYRLQPAADSPGQLCAVVMDRDPLPLCRADQYYGEEGRSSVREESDLAPFKPRCDVIINGHAHAPGGRPTQFWEAGVRLSAPASRPVLHVEPPKPWRPGAPLTEEQLYAFRDAKRDAEHRMATAPTREVFLDKRLRFCGPRRFEKGFFGWSITDPEPALTVPLQWEYAFGGSSVIYPSNEQVCSPENRPVLNEVCYSNPLGRGWLHDHHIKAARNAGELIKQLPAPQIEAIDSQLTGPYFCERRDGDVTASEMRDAADSYPIQPAGFGVVGRPWAPRLALAGTYDDAWLQERSPGLPEDFDFAYWNGAPVDQQIAFPPPNLSIELFNLVDPRLSSNGRACVELPGHRPFVLLRLHNGVMLPLPCLTDTLLIDTDAMTLSLTHRISFPKGIDLRVLEARFEVDPNAPLLKRKSRNSSGKAGDARHG
ncbi:DUF2169 family type VI secretion system accessory protein [Pseudomonas sp. S32]|uniref:DUF2169 family type VI secretion system accessory protein n=1 Tax=Pseudomonas sp. S32 TaxID=2767448 RepID=UPI0019140EF8|nr:DUF2169 domain-containing protein [Pseudomonas sp. S32]MBK5006076.1 DUF2169 domain-containing protein [Pseudomonas sp. S32]